MIILLHNQHHYRHFLGLGFSSPASTDTVRVCFATIKATEQLFTNSHTLFLPPCWSYLLYPDPLWARTFYPSLLLETTLAIIRSGWKFNFVAQFNYTNSARELLLLARRPHYTLYMEMI